MDISVSFHVRFLRRPHRAALGFAAVWVALVLLSCSESGYSGKAETITIGAPPLEQNALLYVAEERGMFQRNGLRVVIRDYDSGATSLGGLLNGEVNVAGTAEFPFVKAVIERKEELRAIVCNDRFENGYILARKDRGITGESDLKGKRIGLTLGTINEFYLGRLLALNGLKIRDVILVDLKPAQYAEAFAAGKVDAIIAWHPYVHRIQNTEDGGVLLPAQSSQAAYGLLVCRSGWLKQHADTVERLLKSLLDAEQYLLHHPREAKAIVQKRLNYDYPYIEQIWPQHRFSLSIDQTLVVAMKDEAQWLINHELTREKTIPDFEEHVYTKGLKALKPDAVKIIP